MKLKNLHVSSKENIHLLNKELIPNFLFPLKQSLV